MSDRQFVATIILTFSPVVILWAYILWLGAA